MGKRAPRGLRFFFDASFPTTLARALGELDGENEYRHLVDEMAGNTLDVDWIPVLDRERIVVSGDGGILTKPYERQVWIDSGLRGFFLSKTFPNKSLWEQAKFVVDRWEKILLTASKATAGATFILPWGAGLKIEEWPKKG